jgi:NAD(P)-dependent dehydrogenase (short-subunit alcohol dehydrogenase family)
MKSALITGTSSGFGLLATVELAKRGWHVIATMRNLARRADLDQALAAASVATKVTVAELDVADSATLAERTRVLLADNGGKLDAVVHNAGVAVAAAFEDLPVAEMHRVMDTNFFGVLNLTRALLPTFRAQRSGRIIIVSSESAFAGEPTNAIYCASKFAVEGFAESLIYEVAPFGINIVLVEPGPYKTAIWGNSPYVRPVDTAYGPLLDQLWPTVEKMVDQTAGDPQEVALAIAKALETPKPRFRYPVGTQARITWFLRGKVASPLLRAGISRYLGIHKVKL